MLFNVTYASLGLGPYLVDVDDLLFYSFDSAPFGREPLLGEEARGFHLRIKNFGQFWVLGRKH